MNVYLRFWLAFFASIVGIKLFLDVIDNEFIISFVLAMIISILYVKDDG